MAKAKPKTKKKARKKQPDVAGLNKTTYMYKGEKRTAT